MSEEKKQTDNEESQSANIANVSSLGAKKIEVPTKFQDIVQKIEQMNVLDLSELVKILEKKFNVSSQMPMMPITGAGVAGETAGKELVAEEKSFFTVELANMGAKKIDVIKAVRAVTELGLKDAKDLVEAAPKTVKENVTKEEAENIKKQLEAAGATVVLK